MGWTAWEKVPGFEFTDIIYERKYLDTGGGVARMTINRPEVLNAFTDVTMEEIRQALSEANLDPTIGVVVLTGAGDKAFSTGGDVRWEAKGGTLATFQSGSIANTYLRTCRKPIIAAIKGYAIGGGHHLAYCCDFSIAADNAIFGQNGPRVGSPISGWPVSYLVRVVGAKKAREIWMLCRRYTAQEALEMGLVNVVVPLDKLEEEVDKWCEEILALSPTCIQILKASFDAEMDTIAGSYGEFTMLMAPDFIGSAECTEAQQAFFERRKPDFWKLRGKPPV